MSMKKNQTLVTPSGTTFAPGQWTFWLSGQRPECDIHRYLKQTPGVPAAVDGRTDSGKWANMCDSCFEAHGVGLGVGSGQRIFIESETDTYTIRES